MVKKINSTYFTSTAVLQYLRQQLEDGLLYINNTPRLYQNTEELQQQFQLELNKMKNLFKKIKDPNTLQVGTLQVDSELDSLANQLSLPELTEIGWDELKRYADTLYVDHQRRIMQNNQKIPKYIYVILLLLGWNELMLIISNPIYLVFGSFVGLAFIAILQLGLMPVVQHMAQEFIVKVVDFGQSKMKDYQEKQKRE